MTPASLPCLGQLEISHFNEKVRWALDYNRQMILAAMDRLEAELEPSGYLVGEQFSVADLTAAALLYPAVMPPEFPYPLVSEVPGRGRPSSTSRPTDPAGAG